MKETAIVMGHITVEDYAIRLYRQGRTNEAILLLEPSDHPTAQAVLSDLKEHIVLNKEWMDRAFAGTQMDTQRRQRLSVLQRAIYG